MQGACAGAIPSELKAKIEATGAPLQPLAPNQCLLVTDLGGIRIVGSGNAWIDNLYIRAMYTARTPLINQALLTAGFGTFKPSVYLTGIKLQGDNVFERAGEVNTVIGLAVSTPTYVAGADQQKMCVSVTRACGRNINIVTRLCTSTLPSAVPLFICILPHT